MPASEEFDAALTYLGSLTERLDPAYNLEVRHLVRELIERRREVARELKRQGVAPAAPRNSRIKLKRNARLNH